MRIIRLEAENVKRIKVVAIQPNGKSVIIRGNNEQGKSSLLDSIEFALGGKRSHPKRVIRDGAEKAHVIVELDDLVVERTWETDDISKLEVKTKDGLNHKSPQKILDQLVGKLSFDPLNFMHLNTKDQFEMLRKLVGIDFTDLDEQHKTIYDKRTDVNREVERIKLNLPPADPDMPEAEVPVSKLVDQLQAANKKGAELDQARHELDSALAKVKQLAERRRELQTALEQVVKEGEQWAEDVKTCGKVLENMGERPDTIPIEQQLHDAEAINIRYRAAEKWREENAAMVKGQAESDELTGKIKTLDAERRRRVEEAKFPVKGLSFQNSIVVYEELPFEQASQSVKLRVSVAMGIAMNPKLRVILIREGSFLDAEHLAMVGKMADEADAQVWVEMVGDEGSGVIIEDGMVKEQQRGAA